MSLKDTLKEDLKSALKSGDSFKRTVLGGLSSAIKNRELEKRGKLSKSGVAAEELESQSALSDEEVIEVVGSEIKKRKESITTFESAGRQELAENEKKELEVLMKYMPEQMPEDAVRAIVQKAVSDLGVTDPKEMGKVIGQVMPQVKGRVEGSVVSRLVQEEIARAAQG